LKNIGDLGNFGAKKDDCYGDQNQRGLRGNLKNTIFILEIKIDKALLAFIFPITEEK